ncbi:MAG: LacI family DNA-binding transcriptional regulator [Verrucomicrobiae bacterium]|nr:LacI family DNA-binding transcriptional regulator [Verrucomicrobiae bacterium]
MRVTLRDIAKRVGVAKTTVSMALRESHRISPARRREIQGVAKQMGYVPDPFLSGLAAHSRERMPTRSQGVLAWVNHWDDPKRLFQFNEFKGYWRGANQAASQFGYRLDEVRWERDCAAKRFERILLARGIEGVLVPPHNELLDWEDFDWNKFSVIRFGMSVQNPDSNQVTSDIFRAVVMAITKIHEYGYRRIGIAVNRDFNERLGGSFLSGYFYAQTLLQLKTALPPLETGLKFQDAESFVRQKAPLQRWLGKHRPDAVLAADIDLPKLIQSLGLRIPQDLAVAGTTVLDLPGVNAGIDQHPEAIGRIAVEMLVKQINVNERGEPHDPCRILVESRWKDGDSLPPKKLVQALFTSCASP